LIQGDDNKIQNSEDINLMITDNSNEGDDMRYKVEGQDGVEDSENVIEKEIPLVRSYKKTSKMLLNKMNKDKICHEI
jgi:hypothetical protein